MSVSRALSTTVDYLQREPSENIVATGGGHSLSVLDYRHDGWNPYEGVRLLETYRQVADAEQFRIITPDCRLAPELPFAVAQDDLLAAVRWLVKHVTIIGASATRVAIDGYCVGGIILPTAVGWKLRDRGSPRLALQPWIRQSLRADVVTESHSLGTRPHAVAR